MGGRTLGREKDALTDLRYLRCAISPELLVGLDATLPSIVVLQFCS